MVWLVLVCDLGRLVVRACTQLGGLVGGFAVPCRNNVDAMHARGTQQDDEQRRAYHRHRKGAPVYTFSTSILVRVGTFEGTEGPVFQDEEGV